MNIEQFYLVALNFVLYIFKYKLSSLITVIICKFLVFF